MLKVGAKQGGFFLFLFCVKLIRVIGLSLITEMNLFHVSVKDGYFVVNVIQVKIYFIIRSWNFF